MTRHRQQRPKHCRQMNATYTRNCQDHFRKMKCPFHTWKLAESQQGFWWKVLSGLSLPQTAWTTVSNCTQCKVRHLFHIKFWGGRTASSFTLKVPSSFSTPPPAGCNQFCYSLAPPLQRAPRVVQLLCKMQTREIIGVSPPLGSRQMK